MSNRISQIRTISKPLEYGYRYITRFSLERAWNPIQLSENTRQQITFRHESTANAVILLTNRWWGRLQSSKYKKMREVAKTPCAWEGCKCLLPGFTCEHFPLRGVPYVRQFEAEAEKLKLRKMEREKTEREAESSLDDFLCLMSWSSSESNGLDLLDGETDAENSKLKASTWLIGLFFWARS